MSMSERFTLALSGVDLKTVPLHHATLSAYALNFHGRPALVVKLPPDFHRDVSGTRGIDVQVDSVGDADRYIRFHSETLGMTPMFEAVVSSLLESTSAATTVIEALDLLLDHFEQLQSMFASRGGALTEAAIRGLFAELLLLLELRDAGYTAEAAISAWQGPYRVAKDFILTDRRCIEVKSIRRVNHTIKIANTDQLDPRDEDLRLAVVPLEKCAPGDGMALIDLYAAADAWMRTQPSAQVSFLQALSALCFAPEDPYYQKWHFQKQDWKWYSVQESFPRIRREHVPTAITHVTYSIDIDLLDEFTSDSFWAESD